MSPREIVIEYRATLAKAEREYQTALTAAGYVFDAAEVQIELERGVPPDVDNAAYWEAVWPDFVTLWGARDAAHLNYQAALGAAIAKLRRATIEPTKEEPAV